jgi:phenylalanyl-tRNA synthetase beta chain
VRAPISWLREFVDLPAGSDEIAERLASLGFPVEEIVRRPRLSGIVAGKIVALEKHPNADRLAVGRIDVGGDRPLAIATAATNVAVGQVIPVATVGAQLPGLRIERRKMRGVESEGMMCSADELALPPEWFEDGIMQLDDAIAPGTDVVAAFGLNDDVLEIEITSNRVDVMSIAGVARELAASYRKTLRMPSLENPGDAADVPGLEPRVTIESQACNRFVAQRFDEIRIAPAPAAMRVRLAMAGQRPINNVVDVSNYVMLETGQPLHFYDDAKIADRRLIVREARPGERLTTLDDVEQTLAPETLVIADATGPLGLAGLKGGKSSEVDASTSAIVLESANFSGAPIRRTSMRLGFRTEASARHEKTLPPALADAGAARAAQLLVSLGARAYRPHDFGATVRTPAPIVLPFAYVKRILGLALPPARIEEHLEALGCLVESVADVAHVTPPPWRSDIAIAADLVEEVARLEGYDAIVAELPAIAAHAIESGEYQLERRVAAQLAALGYREIVSYALHGPKLFERMERSGVAPSGRPVEVKNPLSEDQRFLRYALGPGLVEYCARVASPVRIFEIGHTFAPGDDGGAPRESAMLAFGFSVEPGDDPFWHDAAFLRLKGDCETLLASITGGVPGVRAVAQPAMHPGKSAALTVDGADVGGFGMIDPRVAAAFDAPLPIYAANVALDRLPAYRAPRYRAPSRFPSTYRDLALVVNLAVAAADVERTAAGAIGDLCTNARVFDEYRGPQVGEDRKSLALRVTMQRFDATITDAEADAAVARALAALGEDLGAAIRT